MRPVVVYYSKTGNTRRVAEAMARSLQTEALPLNLAKKGRRNKAELAKEKALREKCLSQAEDAGIVLIGTPTEFRRPHPMVVKFIKEAAFNRAAVFCTCYGMVGATLIDMEALLRQKGKQFMGGLAVRVGTDKYRFRQDVNRYVDRLSNSHLSEAADFARAVVRRDALLPVRLHGVCGRDCRRCSKYQSGECEGAGARCWSGRNCEVFDCCIIKKSLTGCDKCKSLGCCSKRDSRLRAKARQHGGVASGSRPFRSETNGTSSAAGSRR